MKRKVDLDRQVAVLVGKKTSEVSLVTQTFLRQVIKELVEHREVKLDGLGDLSLYINQCKPYRIKLTNFDGAAATLVVRKQYHLGFKKAMPLRKAITDRYGPAARKEKDHGKVRSRRDGGPGKPGKSGRGGVPRVRSTGH